MTKSKVVLLLGTNLGNRAENLKQAKIHLSEIGEIESETPIMETEPVGFTADQDFLNQILLFRTDFSPIKLLVAIKEVEKSMGRIYTQPREGEKYVSRIIDIDILFYEKLIFSSKVLNIPHHQVKSRDFVRELLKNNGLAE
ncbi:2-amino-4-hydroxy-6-hydroxymethyldihydropteridine diphosphokinase [Ornithobacterium rhinotracheale]|uniref:2-amino-4-hydroxy-6- hydroxymethyldihydropteridine diphosphokinase n=1 Tax=Ornithobacterium rhinotracheale TaxID=28251 RepID=UPI00129C68F8|nr:2-amino-4-hydroxy-6-hydroxymethyldihydropteridine diphosphokinase [Ornithobacterium rhinotracheale]MRI62426.1 2-amino-4-hydroxy-6-hydroxymethyldihydropteridine diphosphokinase [Ornithobacterium rhinotracheale]